MTVIITAVGDAKDATMIVIILVIIFIICCSSPSIIQYLVIYRNKKGTLDILGNAKDAMMIVIKEQVVMQRML